MFSEPCTEAAADNPLIADQFKPFSAIQMPDITVNNQDIRKAITSLKTNASPGPDGLISNCFKKWGTLVSEALYDIYGVSQVEEIAPDDFKEAWINPTWKGKIKSCKLSSYFFDESNL